MLKAQLAETSRNIRSVHITLVTYRYLTKTLFFNSMALVILVASNNQIFQRNCSATLSSFKSRDKWQKEVYLIPNV